MGKNQIRPIPPTLGSSKKTMRPRATQGPVMFFEKDLPLPGIVKETNNYPPGKNFPVYYYDPVDYYEEVNGLQYYQFEYI